MSKGVQIKVGVKMSAAMQKLNRFRRKLSKISAPVKKLASLFAKFAAIGAAAIIGVIAIVIKLTNSVVDLGDTFDKMSKRTGIAIEILGQYKHALELSGSSLQAFERATKKMSTFLLDAERGLVTNTYALNELGLTAQDFANLSPEAKFEKLAAALSKIADPTKRAALAQKVFGRAGTELLPMLEQGSAGINKMRADAIELGIVMSGESSSKLANFRDEATRLKGAIGGIKNDAVLMFIDTFGKYIKQVTEKIIELRTSGQLYEYIADAGIKVVEFGATFLKIFNAIKTISTMAGKSFISGWTGVFKIFEANFTNTILIWKNNINKILKKINLITGAKIKLFDTEETKNNLNNALISGKKALAETQKQTLTNAFKSIKKYNQKMDKGVKKHKKSIKKWQFKKQTEQKETNAEVDNLRNNNKVSKPTTEPVKKNEKPSNKFAQNVNLSDSLSRIGINVSNAVGNTDANLSKQRNNFLKQINSGISKVGKSINNLQNVGTFA
ncbi:hypothetical protein AAEX28_04170 [Lentisphaerota bacterium WC36G]|nr:hypothetical protein LJT99_07040 [Lentisphaerae bacterium WC36]